MRRPAPTAADLMPEQQAVRRHYLMLLAGQHPAGETLGEPLPLHPEAAPITAPDAPGLRCRTCPHRQPREGRCGPDGAAPGVPVRVWWPACSSYQHPTQSEEPA